MDFVQTMRKLHSDGTERVSGAVADLNMSWTPQRRRRSRQLKRLLIVTGFLCGLAAVAALLVYTILNDAWKRD